MRADSDPSMDTTLWTTLFLGDSGRSRVLGKRRPICTIALLMRVDLSSVLSTRVHNSVDSSESIIGRAVVEAR